MESEILEIIIRMVHNDKIKELYDGRCKEIEFPPKYSLKPNFKVLADFSDDYFFKYENILLKNAIIYSIITKNKDYTNYIKQHIYNIKEHLEKDLIFRVKTAELGIENIINKQIKKIDKDKEIIDANKHLFKKFDELYTYIEPIFITFRKIIMNFLNKTNENEKEILLDNFLLSNKFDKFIVELSNNLIHDKEIKIYKNLLIRLILCDNYLHIESVLNDEEIIIDEYDNMNNDIILKNFDYDTDEDEEYEEDIDEEFDEALKTDKDYDQNNIAILNYIKSCIDNNEFLLPNNIELRYGLYSRFISYNIYLDNRESDYELIKDDKNKVLNLKKINPLYKLEIKNYYR